MFKDYFVFLIEEIKGVFNYLYAILPDIITSLIIVILTLAIANLVKIVSVKLLRLAGVNVISKKAGLDKLIEPAEIAKNISELIGVFLYWLILFIGIAYALSYLNINPAKTLYNNLINYLPSLFISLFIIVAGIYLSNFLFNLTFKLLTAAKIRHAKSISLTIKFIIIILTILTVIEELAFNLEYLKNFILIILSGVMLIIVIVIGIGSISFGKDITAGTIIRKHFKANSNIEYMGEISVFISCDTFVTTIKQGDKTLTVRNSIFIDKDI